MRTAPAHRSRTQAVSTFLLAALLSMLVGMARADPWTTFTRQDGLDQNWIIGLAPCDSGRVLVATCGHVYRYDGLRFEPRFPPPGQPIDFSCISAVHQAVDGALWVATDAGAYRIDAAGSVAEFTAYPYHQITKFRDGLDGALWAASPQGLLRISGPAESVPVGGRITGLAVDPRDGSIWAINEEPDLIPLVLYHLDGQGNILRQYYDYTLRGTFDLLASRRGALWLTANQSLFQFDPVAGQFNAVAGFPSATNPGATPSSELLAESPFGQLWVGRWNDGLVRCDPRLGPVSRFQVFEAGSGIASNNVTALARDAAGVLWIGTTDGLTRYRGAAWEAFRRQDLPPYWASYPNTQFRRVGRAFTDSCLGRPVGPEGVLWIDGGNGGPPLTALIGDEFVNADSAAGLTGLGGTTSIAADRRGESWIGRSAGLLHVGKASATLVAGSELPQRCQFYSSGIWAVGPREPGAWVGTACGPALFDGDSLRRLPNSGTVLDSALVYGLSPDREGRVWLGTNGGQVSRFDPRDSSYFTIAPDLSNFAGTTVTSFTNGDVWFTHGQAADGTIGLFRWRDGAAQPVPGLAGIRAPAEGPHGQVWAPTYGSGLALVHDDLTWSSFDIQDGVAGTAHIFDVFADSLGLVVTCADDGFSLILPDTIPPRAAVLAGPPRVSGSPNADFVVQGGDVDSDPNQVQVASQLDAGSVSAFAAAGVVHFQGLSDGTHTLRLWARDRMSNVSPVPFEWQFEVDQTPPRPSLADPGSNAILQGRVVIRGQVSDSRFAGYVVEARAAGAASWDTLFASSVLPQAGDTLGTWDTTREPDGVFELRLGVRDTLGLLGTASAQVVVDNHAPSADRTSPARIVATSGGDVYTTDGRVHTYFPPRFFSSDVTVTIDTATVPAAPPFAPGWARAGDAHAITWNGATGGKSAILELGGLPDSVLAGSVAIWDSLANTPWERLGGTVEQAAHRISVPILLPGVYVLLAGNGTGPAAAQPLTALTFTPRVFSPRGTLGNVEAGIGFSLAAPGPVTVRVYNRAGRLVRELADRVSLQAGANLVRWDGRDAQGQIVTDDIYIVRVEANGRWQQGSLAVLR